jgi:hypothetical protein
MSDTTTARYALHQNLAPLVYSDAQANRMIDAYRDQVLAEAAEQLLPPWVAVYESATFTSHHIADCTSEGAARGAAEAWLRSHCADAAGLKWTLDPQQAVGDWDQWLELTRTDPETGTVLATDIVVRRRAARTTTQEG